MADRLRTLMRWRGIRSQRQLARLSGVPQTSIHRILTRDPGYLPALGTLTRLARTLDTTVLWLSEGEAGLHATVLAARQPRPQECGTIHPHHQQGGGDAAELHMLMAKLSDAERRHVVALVRMLADRPSGAAGDARRP